MWPYKRKLFASGKTKRQCEFRRFPTPVPIVCPLNNTIKTKQPADLDVSRPTDRIRGLLIFWASCGTIASCEPISIASIKFYNRFLIYILNISSSTKEKTGPDWKTMFIIHVETWIYLILRELLNYSKLLFLIIVKSPTKICIFNSRSGK